MTGEKSDIKTNYRIKKVLKLGHVRLIGNVTREIEIKSPNTEKSLEKRNEHFILHVYSLNLK